MAAQPISLPKRPAAPVALIAVLGVAVLWSYWTTLVKLAWRWSEDPQYSHGYLVPAFAVWLLWLRRDQVGGRTLSSSWIGLVLLAVAMALRLAGAYTAFDFFDQISLLPCLAGLFLLASGRPALAWSWPAILFLAFMIPLPDRVSHAMAAPMQRFATTVSTFVLQVLGRPAVAEGNIIHLNDLPLGIVEACSGLRMLVVFFALSTAVALLIRKSLWEKMLIAASAVPIALAANVLRITVTGLFYEAFGNHFGGEFFHDLAGWLMMPLGLTFLAIEMWILRKLLIERDAEAPNVIVLQRVAVSQPVPARKEASVHRDEEETREEKAVPV